MFRRRSPPPVRPPPSPPSPPATVNNILQKPWRKYKMLECEWTEEMKNKLMENIRLNLRYNNYNIAFIGPLGSGKSSVINSFISILNGDVTCRTPTAASGSSSRTQYFQQIRGKMDYQKIAFYDTRGIEEMDRGIHLEDTKKVAEGKIPLGYKFVETPMKDSKVDENLRIHCLVYVLDAENVKNSLNPEFQKKITDVMTQMKHIRTAPNEILILTHVDCADEDVNQDITNIFNSNIVKDVVTDVNYITGIQVNAIFPVRCYATEMELDPLKDIPLLLALKKMVSYSNDTIDTWRENNYAQSQQQCNCL